MRERESERDDDDDDDRAFEAIRKKMDKNDDEEKIKKQ